MELSETNYQCLLNEIDYWKKVALYLADCHSTTAYKNGKLKSFSKAEKKRLMLVCERAACLIERSHGSTSVSYQSADDNSIKQTINWCRESAQDIRDELESTKKVK